MIKLQIDTIRQREKSWTKTWIAIIWSDNKIKRFLWLIKKENWDRWVEFEWELEEWTLVKMCYNWSYSGLNKDYYLFKVWDKIKQGMEDLVKYL